jgi:hypothetical protein
MAANRIGHYTIVSELGRGGMGVVFKAHEESLNRFVAIKLLGEHLSEDPTFVARFVREAQAAAGLSHPNIIQIFFIGEDNGRHYFVMEYVSGKSLLAMVREEGKITNPRAAQFMLQAANGLAAAHDKGFLHRDIKPANLMIDERGLLKIADFGLALPQDAATRLTATGMLVGTPGYLSPEQCMGEKLDHRTDIYSLGVTYFEILTGRLPFQADSPLALLRKILEEQPPDISTLGEGIDGETQRIVNRMIAKSRDQRYQDCHELAGDLESYVAAHDPRGATRGAIGARMPAAPSAPATAPAGDAPTTRMPSSASTATVAVTPTGPAAPSPPPPPAPAPHVAVASREVQAPPPPSAMIPAPVSAPVVAAPVAAPAAVTPKRRSSAPVILLVAVVVVVLAGAVGAFLVLRSPLVRGFIASHLPFGAHQASATATLAESPATSEPAAAEPAKPPDVTAPAGGPTGVPPSGEAAGAAPAAALEHGAPAESKHAAAGTGEPSVEATSRRSFPLTAPSEGAQRRESRRQMTVPAAAATEAERSTAPILSGVAVATLGEQPLAGSVAAALLSALGGEGLQPVDAASLAGTEEMLASGSRPSASELISALRAQGIAVLVLAKVDRVGERQLQYMNRYDTAYSDRVTITCYDVATGRPRGSPSSATVEYTSLNADRNAEKALGPLTGEIARLAR